MRGRRPPGRCGDHREGSGRVNTTRSLASVPSPVAADRGARHPLVRAPPQAGNGRALTLIHLKEESS